MWIGFSGRAAASSSQMPMCRPYMHSLHCHLLFYRPYCTAPQFNSVSIRFSYIQADFVKESWTIHNVIRQCFCSMKGVESSISILACAIHIVDSCCSDRIEAGRFFGLILGPIWDLAAHIISALFSAQKWGLESLIEEQPEKSCKR